MRIFAKPSTKSHRAFTLVEAIVYVTILGVVGGAITAMIIMMYRFQTIVQDRAQLNEDLRVLIKSIRDDMYLGDALEVNAAGELIVTSSFSSPNSVRYYVENNQVFRQAGAATAVAITHSSNNVQELTFQDISTPHSAGVIRLTINISNYPRAPLKPEVSENVTSTISLKFL